MNISKSKWLILISAIWTTLLAQSYNFAKHKNPDCFFCSQNIPNCPTCEDDQFCFISKQSCYQCSRAFCANKRYFRAREICSSNNPKCSCSCVFDETCLITTRTQISCPKANCIELIDPKIRFLKDYYP